MSRRPERGSGLLSTVFGVGVVMVMLGVCANVAIGLWTRSVVDSVAYDAARDVATAPPGADPSATRASAIDRAEAALGEFGRRVRFEFESAPEADHVVLRVTAPANSLLPAVVTGGSIVGPLDRRIVIRREAP